jgi:hypothetical protein
LCQNGAQCDLWTVQDSFYLGPQEEDVGIWRSDRPEEAGHVSPNACLLRRRDKLDLLVELEKGQARDDNVGTSQQLGDSVDRPVKVNGLESGAELSEVREFRFCKRSRTSQYVKLLLTCKHRCDGAIQSGTNWGLDHTYCSGFAKSPWAIDCPVMPVAPTMKTLSLEDIWLKEIDVVS